MEVREIYEKLKEIPLFKEFKDDAEKMSALDQICRINHFKKGKVIIQEGDLGSEMYILISGGVEIVKQTRAGDTYTVVRLRAEDNVFFGELALIDDDKRSATIVASRDSDCVVITKENFQHLGEIHPDIGLYITRAIAKILAGRLRKTTADMLTIFDALVHEINDE